MSKKPLEQIPWAHKTKVTYQGDMSINLESGASTADIWRHNFEWSVSLDSKKMIREYMDLNDRLTRDIQDHFAVLAGRHTIEENVKDWLENGLQVKLLPFEGPKEWRPLSKNRGKRPAPWTVEGDYGSGNTYNEDPAYFWGEKFEFVQFQTDDAEEGVVIDWERGRGPEVYLGNFSDFMSAQHEGDPFSYETFLHINRRFENGFMWAWEKLGVFDDPDLIQRDGAVIKGVLDAIERDPSILLPESVEKILLKFGLFPKQIQNAVQWLMNNHKRDLEKALGQRLIWGDLYRE